MMDLPSAVGSALINARNFGGRAARSEFWWTILFLLGMSLVAGLFDWAFNAMIMRGIEPFLTLWSVALVFLFSSLSIRRLHDFGRSGLWAIPAILAFAQTPLDLAVGITIAEINEGFLGAIMSGINFYTLALFAATIWPGTRGPNRFGPDPLMYSDHRRRAEFGG